MQTSKDSFMLHNSKHQLVSVMSPQMIQQSPQSPEPGSVVSLSPPKQQLEPDASLIIYSEENEGQGAIAKDRGTSMISGFENSASPGQTSSAVKKEQVQDSRQKPKDFTVLIKNKRDSITYEYDLLDSNVKKQDEQHKMRKARFGKQQQQMDKSALHHSLKIEKLQSAIASENAQTAKIRKGQNFELRVQNPNLSFAKKSSTFQSPCFKLSTEYPGLDLTKEIQDSFERYDNNESKEKDDKGAQDVIGSRQTTDKCGRTSSHRYIEQQQYLPLQKLNLLNINVQSSSKKQLAEVQASTPISQQDITPQPHITSYRFLSSRQRRGILKKQNIKKPERLSGSNSAKLQKQNSKTQERASAYRHKQDKDQKWFPQTLKPAKSSTYLAAQKFNKVKNEEQYGKGQAGAFTNEYQKELKKKTDIRSKQLNLELGTKSVMARSSSANTGAAQVTFFRAPSELKNQFHKRSRQGKCTVNTNTDQGRNGETDTSPYLGNNTDLGLNFELIITPQKSVNTRPPERKLSGTVSKSKGGSSQAVKTIYEQGKSGSKGRENTVDDDEILESENDVKIMQPTSSLDQPKKSIMDSEQAFKQVDQLYRTQQSQQYQFSKSSRIIIQNAGDQGQSRNQRFPARSQPLTLKGQQLQNQKFKTPTQSQYPPPDPPKSIQDKTSETRTAEVIPTSLHSIDEKISFQEGTDKKGQGSLSVGGILSSQRSTPGKVAKKTKLYETTLENCPLKSVREKEELELIYIQQNRQDEKNMRAINRAQFEERQNDLAFRKASQQMEKRKVSKLINKNLMGSPMQQLGKLSQISQRQDALLGDSTTVARDHFLSDPINLKNEVQKSASPKVKKQPQEGDYFKMNISSKLRTKINNQYQLRVKQQEEERERLKKVGERISRGFLSLFTKPKDQEQKQKKEKPKRYPLPRDQRFSSKDEANDNAFKIKFIQTNQDQTVFLRLNPHLPNTRGQVNLADQSLNDLLKKNNGLPAHEMQSSADNKKDLALKKYRDMNEFQKETHNFINKLRRDISYETLYAKLQEYIKVGKDQEKLTEFCRELVKTKNVIREQQAAKLKMVKKQQLSARKQQPEGSIQSPQSGGSPPAVAKKLSEKIKQKQNIKSTQSKGPQELQKQFVEAFLSEKENEKARKAQLEQEEREFQKITKQKKGSRFYMTKQERENVLQKLDDVYILEEEQKKHFDEHVKYCKKERHQRDLQYDLDYYFEQKDKKAIQKIKDQINSRKGYNKYTSEASKQQHTSQSARVSGQHSKSASILQDTKYTDILPTNRSQSTISEVVQLTDDETESESFGPPPQDAVLLQQQGIDFLDLGEEIILQNLFKQFLDDQEEEQIQMDKCEMKIEVGNMDQTFGDEQKKEGKVHSPSYQKQEEVKNQLMLSNQSLNIKSKQLLENNDNIINVDNELQDLDFFKQYVSIYDNKQKTLDKKLGKYQRSPDEINEGTQNSQSSFSKMNENVIHSEQTNRNLITNESKVSVIEGPLSSQLDKEASLLEMQNSSEQILLSPTSDQQQFGQHLSFGTNNFTRNMNLLSSDQNKKGNSMSNTVKTILQKKQKRDPSFNKLEQTVQANINLLKNIHHKRNIQQGRKWGLQTTSTVLNSPQMNTNQKSTDKVQTKTMQLDQKSNRKRREFLSKDKQNLYDITRMCHDELPPEMIRFGQQPGSKSTTNLQKMDKRLSKTRDQQENIIDKIEKVYNNLDRVRVNEPADDYEDILISNIQEEDDEAQKFEKKHVKAVKGVYDEEKWAKCVLSEQTKMRYKDPNSVNNIRLYFKSHLQDFTEAETS